MEKGEEWMSMDEQKILIDNKTVAMKCISEVWGFKNMQSQKSEEQVF